MTMYHGIFWNIWISRIFENFPLHDMFSVLYTVWVVQLLLFIIIVFIDIALIVI